MLRFRIVTVLAAVLMLMLSFGPAGAAEVMDAGGSRVASAYGIPVTSADRSATGNHTLTLSVYMLAAAVLASPLTVGGSLVTVSIAWPAVIGAGAAGYQVVRKRW